MMIEYALKKYKKRDLLRILDEDVAWWFNRFDTLTPPQEYGVFPITKNRNVLISSPTGSGKTLTAFIYIISELFKLAKKGGLEDHIYALYISPLRALNNDIYKNLTLPLEEINRHIRDRGLNISEIRVGLRTGDTTQSERARMLRYPPHILITTPESLALVITAPKFRLLMNNVKWVVIDEIHSLCENKRGSHLSLSLERLEENVEKSFVRIGLSATINPLEEVAQFLVGYVDEDNPRDCVIVDTRFNKRMILKLRTPVKDIIYSSSNETSSSLYRYLSRVIGKYKTTLIFTNTRSGAERITYHLKKLGFLDADELGIHHSSLSRELRFDIENRLKIGLLRGIVTSTSLELGIDIGYIDGVVQIGSPKSINRGLQRIGRSGHSMEKVSKGYFIALDLDELIEDGVLISEAYKGRLDMISIPKNALDVLAQHIVGMALVKKWRVDEAYKVVRRAYPYKDLKWEKFISLLHYLSGRYHGLEEYRVYGKIWLDEENGYFGRRGRYLRPIYFQNIGTIPEKISMIAYHGRRRIGYLEEMFVEHLDYGDIFLLGGRTYRFMGCSGNKVFVEPAPGFRPTVPSWISELLPLTFDLGEAISSFRWRIWSLLKDGEEEARHIIYKEMNANRWAIDNIIRYIRLQAIFLRNLGVETFHSPENLIIENFIDRKSNTLNIIFHTVFGRRVNNVLARAYALVAREKLGISVKILVDDHNFVLVTPAAKKLDLPNVLSEVNRDNLRVFISKAVKNSQFIWRVFRHVANRSFMILSYYKGRKTSIVRQQMNSELLYNALRDMNDFPIIEEAVREIIEDRMDVSRAEDVLDDLGNSRRRWIIVPKYDVPSPFAHGVLLRGMQDTVLMEDRVRILQELYHRIMERIEGVEYDKSL